MKHEFLPRRTLAGLLLFSLIGSTAEAATFMVTNTNDDGAGSLRKAIEAAEANAGADTIDFSVSGTIALQSTLPSITKADGLTIDGTGQNVIISGNDTVRVMYVATGAALALRHLTVAHGFARNSGGAILNFGTLTVEDSSFADNHAGVPGRDLVNGGAIANYGTLTITDSTFSDNSAEGEDSPGGAIMNGATLTVTDSTFSGNSGDSGGAIYNHNFSTATVTNCTFTDNSAVYFGGAIFNGLTLTVTNSTFSGNSAGGGGGGAIFNGAILTLTNTILANSPSGGDCYNIDTLNPTGVNLVMDGSCTVSGALSGDPLLGPLADNGGPTQTMALQPGSPAIDAITDGTCPPPAADQRGVSRPQGLFCDIGAFEVEVPASCRTTADLRSGGSNDTVRITNQGNAEMPYTVQFVNAQGTVQGKPVAKSLTPNQSASNTVGSLLQQAGLKTFNPANLLQIRTEPKIGLTQSPLQSVYTPTNGTPPVMMVYTCEPQPLPK